MPTITTKIDRDQRDGLYELVRNHLGAIGDLWLALEQSGDYASAERLGSEFAEDLRLLAEIGWKPSRARPGSTSLGPHLAPGLAPGAILHPSVYIPERRKPCDLQGFREIAGAGFEPATFGL